MTPDFEPVDFHIHTVLSPCAARSGPKAELATYVQRARELGWPQVCISDHIVEDDTLPWMPPFYRGCNERLVAHTRRLAAALDGDIDILIGVEADMVDVDRIAASADMARRVDFLIMPPNHFHMAKHVQPPTDQPADVGRHVWTHMRAAASQPWIDIIAHPFAVFRKDLPPIGQYMPHVPDDDWAEVFDRMAHNRIAIEVNLHCVRKPEYLETTGHLFRLAVDRGVKLSYGSDAHAVRELGRFGREVLPQLAPLGFTASDFATPALFHTKRGPASA